MRISNPYFDYSKVFIACPEWINLIIKTYCDCSCNCSLSSLWDDIYMMSNYTGLAIVKMTVIQTRIRSTQQALIKYGITTRLSKWYYFSKKLILWLIGHLPSCIDLLLRLRWISTTISWIPFRVLVEQETKHTAKFF